MPNPPAQAFASPPLCSNVAEVSAAHPALGYRGRGLQQVLDELERLMPKAEYGGVAGNRLVGFRHCGEEFQRHAAHGSRRIADGSFAIGNINNQETGVRMIDFTATPPELVRQIPIVTPSWVVFLSEDIGQVSVGGGNFQYWLATIYHLPGGGPRFTIENAITGDVKLQRELIHDFLNLALDLKIGRTVVTKRELATRMYMGTVARSGDSAYATDAVESAGDGAGVVVVGEGRSLGVVILSVWSSEGMLPTCS
ncbi:hypothetical protein HK097_009033 [Rhizophlyctis rosea]|uniref:Uncharacterized protein n=1 Tax=Rhizophlyctis rosea TaxID=64517 RepID=A0AAD5X951_9FUNG|nr:hypothetical protein HK097_009033 [Rhizophlyctis rosea]